MVHLLTYLLVGCYFLLIRDHPLVFFIVTHSFWLFSFLLLTYAAAYGVSADRYLVNPILSSQIVVVYLLACMCARLLAGRLTSIRSLSSNEPEGDYLAKVFCILGLVFIPARVAFGSESFWYAVSATFTQFYWLGLYLRFERRPLNIFDPLLLVGIIFCISVSIIDNRRALLFEFALTFTLIYLRTSPHAFAPARLIAAFLGFAYFSRFSDIFLYARIFIGRDRPTELLSFVVSSLASPSFLLAPFGASDPSHIAEALESYISPYSNYRIATFQGRTGIFERATLLPHMDAVVGVLPQPSSVDWSEIVNTILSVLPSLGQEKDTVLGDRLTWIAGLRPPGIVGHPLVTSAGEFFSMGGLHVLFIYVTLIFFLLFLELKLLMRLFGRQSVAIMILFNQAFYMMFTSTAISATAVVIRQIPLLIAIYLLAKSMAGTERRNFAKT
ncbi:hypothetical protein IVB11_17760 [Bradyrhizobium sp. 177]|uniref:hypothetical protein n=1 Tax=Bradyrhizobium sp. 177 TaxID=2782647 RepID=UPI001FFBB827|nr:hypothetical protein [Bradyrhizobium sp. 177]MCK1550851.1 hypothetical protein [Bradyrhizobium sp. 177]